MKRLLTDAPETGIGGVVGFPSGAQSTASKIAEVHEHRALGAMELDMVINVGMLRSGRDRYVEDDIRGVVEAAQGIPVKVILEAHYLTDEEIVRGSRIAVRAGAAFVKTGTGWAPTGATLHNVALIKSAVGEAAQVKAAGRCARSADRRRDDPLGRDTFWRQCEFRPANSRCVCRIA